MGARIILRRCPRGLWCDPAKVVTLLGSGGSNPPRRVKGLYTANIELKIVNTYNASLQTGSYGVFPKSSKETPKISLVFCRITLIGKRSVLKTDVALKSDGGSSPLSGVA